MRNLPDKTAVIPNRIFIFKLPEAKKPGLRAFGVEPALQYRQNSLFFVTLLLQTRLIRNPKNMETRKLYRSQTDQVVAGVCGGLAEHFDIDPVIVRVVFILLAFFGGGGVLIYLILWIALPKKPYDFTFNASSGSGMPDEDKPKEEQSAGFNPEPEQKNTARYRGSLIGGIILLTLGTLFLIDEFIPHWDFGRLWPVILIVIGFALIAGAVNRSKQ